MLIRSLRGINRRSLPHLRNRFLSTTNNIPSFDSNRFVERLESDGFSRQQAEAIVGSLSEVIEESMRELRNGMVEKSEHLDTVKAYQTDFSHLKSEINMLEKNDFVLLKQENDRIAAEVEKLKSKIRDDLARMQSSIRLDMNLDKGRVRDEQNALQLSIKQTESSMEQEITQLRAAVQSVKWDTIKTIGAAATSIGVLILGWARYFKS